MIEPPESLVKVLDHMVENSSAPTADDFIVVVGPKALLYKGNRSDIAAGTGLKIAYVYDAVTTLTNLGAIQQIKKSSRHGPAVYWIISKTVPSSGYSAYVTRNNTGTSIAHPTKWSRMQDAMNIMSERLLSAEAIIIALQARMDRLEHDQKNNEVLHPIQGRRGTGTNGSDIVREPGGEQV